MASGRPLANHPNGAICYGAWIAEWPRSQPSRQKTHLKEKTSSGCRLPYIGLRPRVIVGGQFIDYASNILCVNNGFQIGLLLLSGQHWYWYGPVIVGHVIKTAMHIVGDELILGANQDVLARAVMETILIGAMTVFFLNL
jgi:hypothetical protein